ncbi:disulfide bond formation protein B [Nitrosomonas aestuarii]|uniref:disulfide bond formation protein B n=1 Tax=Nitrosomonas aestuarii TaxID=52441 RepID=UPI000D2F6E67|nr:disulfide bond formation protein B [Nitrosomonas aestuarii]PTN12946.1 thiol:disulfide interchange protein DsbB [Nitrosomonas aestuarii]
MRLIFLFIFLSCICLLGYAQYLQHVENLLPCPLCVAQRLAFWMLGLVALLAFLHNSQAIGRRIYGFLMTVLAIIGAVVAIRQSWLIRYPESFECGISPEEAFLNSLPFAQWWPGMFEANGDCADVDWKFLSLMIPDWSFVAFVGLGLLSAYVVFSRKSA